MSKAGSIEYDVKIKLKNFTTQAKQLDKAAQDAAKKTGDAVDKNVSSGADNAGKAFGRLKASSLLAFAGITAGAVAAGKTILSGIKEFANYEQQVGGVETMFKTSSDELMKYAQNAYKTANMSANQYMENATSFSASLLQGLGGDTSKAAKLADMAITDMSDNANKFGTDIRSIQYAYQGFARQNYIMLGNLKLGYGGTQAEMARLINDSGVMGKTFKATANNINEVPFHKMIEGINEIQKRSGIMGTTLAESSDTLSGSFNMLTASWSNLLAGVEGSDKAFGESLIILGRQVADKVPQIAINIGKGLASGISFAMSSAEASDGIVGALGKSLAVVKGTIHTLVTGDFKGGMFADLIEEDAPFIDFLFNVRDGIKGVANDVGEAIDNMVTVAKPMYDFISKYISPAIEYLSGEIKGSLTYALGALGRGLSGLMPTLKTLGIILGAAAFVIGGVLAAGIAIAVQAFAWLVVGASTVAEIISGVVVGAVNLAIGVFIGIGAVVVETANFFVRAWGVIADTWGGVANWFGQLGARIVAAIGWVGDWIGNKFKAAKDTVVNVWNGIGSWFGGLGGQLVGAGREIVNGLVQGISNGKDAVINKIKEICSGALDQVKKFFGIKSPSRVMAQMGAYMMQGLGGGITSNSSLVSNAMSAVNSSILSGLTPSYSINATGMNADIARRAIRVGENGHGAPGAQVQQVFNQHIGDGVTLDQVNRSAMRQARRYV